MSISASASSRFFIPKITAFVCLSFTDNVVLPVERSRLEARALLDEGHLHRASGTVASLAVLRTALGNLIGRDPGFPRAERCALHPGLMSFVRYADSRCQCSEGNAAPEVQFAHSPASFRAKRRLKKVGSFTHQFRFLADWSFTNSPTPRNLCSLPQTLSIRSACTS